MLANLFDYDLEVIWKPGKTVVIADHLSRACQNNDTSHNINEIEEDIMKIDMENQLAITDQKKKEYKDETLQDDELKLVMIYILDGWPDHKNNLEASIKKYFNYRDDLTT